MVAKGGGVHSQLVEGAECMYAPAGLDWRAGPGCLQEQGGVGVLGLGEAGVRGGAAVEGLGARNAASEPPGPAAPALLGLALVGVELQAVQAYFGKTG